MGKMPQNNLHDSDEQGMNKGIVTYSNFGALWLALKRAGLIMLASIRNIPLVLPVLGNPGYWSAIEAT